MGCFWRGVILSCCLCLLVLVLELVLALVVCLSSACSSEGSSRNTMIVVDSRR